MKPINKPMAIPVSIANATPSHRLPVSVGAHKACQGAHEHDPLEAQVQDAGPLGEGLAESSEENRYGQPHRGR